MEGKFWGAAFWARLPGIVATFLPSEAGPQIHVDLVIFAWHAEIQFQPATGPHR